MEYPVILFDGECGICDRWVQFVLWADRDGRFRFAALKPEDLARVDSVMLRYDGRLYLRSEAVLRTFGLLGFPFRMAAILRLLPASWRDAAYDQVARNRYWLFGRRQTCRVPTAQQRSRFLA
jgi:predicted DCC family thiol-disulfide oxidoreductase YuxK